MSALFDSFTLSSAISLKNRIVMAPMTRSMSNDDLTPNANMINYYARRASAGLIVSEGIVIHPDGQGYPRIPGLFEQKHVEAWHKITEAVHRQDGKIVAQIWHAGRVSHPVYLDGKLPLSPSKTKMSNRVPRSDNLYYGWSRAASKEEITSVIQAYTRATINAIDAGFDGIELHGANGYLIDQFLHYHTNLRDDEYGGSINNRIRFALEVVDAVGEQIGFERVGIRLSPAAYLNEIEADERDADVFEALLTKLNNRNIAYVHTGAFDDSIRYPSLHDLTMTEFIRQHYQGNVIASGSYTQRSALASLEQGHSDLIAFGRPFIANADLVERMQQQQSLETYNESMLATLD